MQAHEILAAESQLRCLHATYSAAAPLVSKEGAKAFEGMDRALRESLDQ